MKCDRCDNEATIHEVTIRSGSKIEKHLCESCGRQEGIEPSALPTPIAMAAQFITAPTPVREARAAAPQATCGACGMTYAEFRKTGHLGCPACYESFAARLGPLLARAHEGGTRHVGKAPGRPAPNALEPDLSAEREHRIHALRRQLGEAVRQEEYERAARIRDELRGLGQGDGPGDTGRGQA